MEQQLTIRGKIWEKDEGGIYVGEDPLAEQLEHLKGKLVTLSYYISKEDLSEKEMLEKTVGIYAGALHARYQEHYSEITGYLWTDDELNVGNHNVIDIVSQHEGKFIQLNLTIHG